MRPIALAIVLASGCASGWEPPTFTGCPWSDDEGVAFVDLASEAWAFRFDGTADYRGLLVECQPGQLVTWTSRADGRAHDEASGVMLSEAHVAVAVGGAERPHDTRLAHELVHVALSQTQGDPDDASHAEGDGPWGPEHDDLIRDLNAER